MKILMEDTNGEFVCKVCEDETWMDVIRVTLMGLAGFGYHIPEDKEKLWKMLRHNMDVNE